MFTKKIAVVAVALLGLVVSNSVSAQEKKKPDPEKQFKRMDANKDGVVTLEELNSNEKTKKLAARFSKIDTDENGEMTLEEFKAFKEKAGKKKKKNVE